MPTLVDIHGNPLSSGTLKQQQSETTGSYLCRQADFFSDMEERDGHLFAELSKRRRAVMPLSWSIEPPRNANAREKAMAAEATEWFQDLPDFESLLFDMLAAIGHGFSPVELEWERAEGIWLPKAFHKRPQRWFQTPQFQGNTITLIDSSQDGAPLQPFGWLLHKHRAKSGWLAESGLFRVLAWSYLFKNLSARDLAEFLEIYGLPMRVGKYPSPPRRPERHPDGRHHKPGTRCARHYPRWHDY
ncbi:phage portal protein family protein [Serratia symbiotica]|uniref:phage portal protein family protein n=1 Tax=Serratia symbiotica TaxID=138074 RepID=UPI003313BC08